MAAGTRKECILRDTFMAYFVWALAGGFLEVKVQ